MTEVPILLPRWGQTMDDAIIVEWLKAEGDPVVRDEPVCIIETDKVDAEVVSPESGVLGRPLFAPRERVEVGTTIATILTDR
jgi:pyruvate/2-oxoglutarate dehydrogenase complex dihydrolipoamide acyltransferase (E2) component